jgi:hypothetical protein
MACNLYWSRGGTEDCLISKQVLKFNASQCNSLALELGLVYQALHGVTGIDQRTYFNVSHDRVTIE